MLMGEGIIKNVLMFSTRQGSCTRPQKAERLSPVTLAEHQRRQVRQSAQRRSLRVRQLRHKHNTSPRAMGSATQVLSAPSSILAARVATQHRGTLKEPEHLTEQGCGQAVRPGTRKGSSVQARCSSDLRMTQLSTDCKTSVRAMGRLVSISCRISCRISCCISCWGTNAKGSIHIL